VEILGPKPPLSIISACRTAVFMGMSRDAVKLAGKGVRKSKDQLLFEEVVTEVDALQQIVGMAKLIANSASKRNSDQLQNIGHSSPAEQKK
jgi:hypothetical protein